MGRGVGDSASASTFSITLARVTSRRRMRRRSSLSSSATDRQSGHRSAKSARWLIRRSGLSCLLCVWWLKFGSRGTRPSESSTQLRMETGRMPVPHWEPGRHTSNIQHPTLNGGPAEAGTSLGSGEPRKPLKAIRATWRSLLRGQQFHHRFHRRISLDGLHLRPDLSGFEFYFAFGE